MAATNFTPIILYHTTTASAAPTAGNLNNGELAINITDGKLFYKDNGGTVQVIATKGTGTIGGSNTQVQYNSSGALAGSANFTFNGTTATINTLNLTNALGTAYGGTALTTYTQGDLVYASAANTLAKLGIGANTYILTSTGSVPQWSAPSAVTVSTANNLAGGAAGSVPYQSGAGVTTFLSIGTANQVLTSSGTAPQWSNLSSLGVSSLSFGTTGLTPSTATQGAITVAGTLATTNGGTGLTSFTANGVVYASSSSALATGSSLTFDGTTLATTGKFGITGNGSLPTATALQIGTNGVGSRWVYNAPSGGEHDFAINGVNIAYVSGTSFGTLNVDATIYGVTVGRGGGAVSTNTALGVNALAASNSGTGRNTGLGYAAMAANTTGVNNTGVGQQALTTNQNGSDNVAVGYASLFLNVSGSTNVAVGVGSLQNTTASANTAVGHQSLNSNLSVSYNTAVGYQAAFSNQTGGITAVGYQAGYAAVTASDLTYIGNSAGLYATGNLNTAVGVSAMRGAAGVSTGAGNTALGYAALYSNRDGVRNTSVGLSSLENNTSGNYNTAVGYQAIAGNTSASSSTAVGYQAGLYQSGGRNTSIGLGAGAGTSASNTTSQSTFIGFNAGTNIQGGSYLVLIGDSAGASNTTGSYNIAIGQNALVTNQSGGSNIAIGAFALSSNLASSNVAIGYQAAFNTTTDTQVIAIGYNALFENTTGGGGSYNIAIGQNAHYYGQTNSYYNIAIGASAHRGTSNGTQTGRFNTAIGNPITPLTTGSYVLGEITSGSQNVALGNGVLGNLTSGNNNTAAGYAAMQKNTTGSNNTAIGRDALFNNISASGNTAIGYTALYLNQTGVNNTALGNAALYYTGGDSNIGIGVSAGQSCTGTANIAIGSGITGVLNSALSNQTGGSYNIAIGSGSLSQIVAAYSNNTAVGHNALFTASGSTNTAVGYQSGSAMTTGSKNTIIGSYSGNQAGLDIRTASNYIVLSDGDGSPRIYTNNYGAFSVGFNSGAGSAGLNQATGAMLMVSDYNNGGFGCLSLGAPSGNYGSVGYGFAPTSTGFVYTNNDVSTRINFGTTLATFTASSGTTGNLISYVAGPYVSIGGTSWTSSSDARLKNVTGGITGALAKVQAMNPVWFSWKRDAANAQNLGFIAQELHQVLPEVVDVPTHEIDPRSGEQNYWGVNYTEIVPLLTAAIQELKSELDSVKAELASLKGA